MNLSKGQILRCCFWAPLLLPHIFIFLFSGKKEVILSDLNRYSRYGIGNRVSKFIFVMAHYKEYRSLFYYRVGKWKYLLCYVPALSSLHIETKNIGRGLFVEHGDATFIAARSIGDNCYINQCVTIGYSNATDAPVLLDNVQVKAGAKIIGKVTVGNNCIVGANAVVVKDVPDNCTVVGVPAYIVKKDGINVRMSLQTGGGIIVLPLTAKIEREAVHMPESIGGMYGLSAVVRKFPMAA